MAVINHLAKCMGIPSVNYPKLKKSDAVRSSSQQSILIADYIHKRQVLGWTEPPPDRICKTVGWLVQEFLSENYDMLASTIDLLEHHQDAAKTDEEVLNKIFDSMFVDGKINWGRIVSTYAFGVKYCSMLKHTDVNGNKRQTSTEKVLQSVGEYVGRKLSSWIDKEGGWEAILSHFPNQEVVMQRLRSAGYLILTVGVGSLLSTLTR